MNLVMHDQARLADLEDVMETARAEVAAGFVAWGTALAEVRDSRLYQGSHGTFEAYCSERWGISRPRAYELMAGAEVVSAIADTGAPAPANEGQARALAAAAPDDRADVMATVAAKGKPTAAAITDEINARRPPAPPPAAPEPEHDVCTACGEIDPPGISGGTCPDCWEASGEPDGYTSPASPTRPAAPAPKRRPLPDQIIDAGHELDRAVERLQKLTGDDRYPHHQNQVGTRLHAHLTRAVETCQGLLDQLATNNPNKENQ